MGIVFIGLGVTGVRKAMEQKEPIESVLNSFMLTMLDRETKKAYDMFSPRGQQHIELADIYNLVTGNNYVLFDGYESISINHIEIKLNQSFNNTAPQGTVGIVAGIIQYDNNISGDFDAILEKINGEWMLFNIEINVPPEKFDSKN